MDQKDRQNLAVALVVVALVVAGVWLMTTMHRNGLIEECLMQHRRNCEALAK